MTTSLAIDALTLPVEGCCKARDSGVLLSASAQRGTDRRVPGRAGGIANPRRADVTDVPLHLVIEGRYDFAGARHTDTRQGLALNVAWLRRYAADPTNTGDGTRTATLNWEGLTPPAKPVHVEGFEVVRSDGPWVLRGVLFLSFPEGLFDLAALIS